MLPAIE